MKRNLVSSIACFLLMLTFGCIDGDCMESVRVADTRVQVMYQDPGGDLYIVETDHNGVVRVPCGSSGFDVPVAN